uniref:hypothetical protein n=1 Tax=Shewanella sp. TaxID=50422 RepID=UPI004048139F
MTADEIYKKYFYSTLKNKVFDEVYEAMQNNSSVDTELLVEQSIQKHSIQPSYATNGTSIIARPSITASMMEKSSFSNSQAGQDLIKIVSEKVNSYNKHQLNSNISNTVETLICLIEVDEMCINAYRPSIKDIINERYNKLDETDQFTITLTTGYRTQ